MCVCKMSLCVCVCVCVCVRRCVCAHVCTYGCAGVDVLIELLDAGGGVEEATAIQVLLQTLPRVIAHVAP